jgi:hypothetical protein
LLPILAPIVLAYVGKQLGQQDAPAKEEASSGGALNDVRPAAMGGVRRTRRCFLDLTGDHKPRTRR